MHRDYTLEVGFNVSFKDFKTLGTECEGMDSEEPAIYMTRKNEKSRLVKRKSASWWAYQGWIRTNTPS